jgi:hypothetical protein
MHIRCRLSDFGAQPVSGGGGMLQLHDRTSDSAPTVRPSEAVAAALPFGSALDHHTWSLFSAVIE